MTEEEIRRALDILQRMESKLDRIGKDIAAVERQMTMMELRVGVLQAVHDGEPEGGEPDPDPAP